MEIVELYKYSWFSDLAYVNWGTDGVQGRDAVLIAIRDEGAPASLAEKIFLVENENFSVVSYHPNDTSGFKASLFDNGSEKVLSICGTEPPGVDLLRADFGEIGGIGVAVHQAVSMFNYIMTLTSDTNQKNVLQLSLNEHCALDGQPLPTDQKYILGGGGDEFGGTSYFLLEASYDGEGRGVELTQGEKLTLTGHSLGGHLAAFAQRLFPDLFDQTVTFNAPGFDPISSDAFTDEIVEMFGEYQYSAVPPAASFDDVSGKILTIVSEDIAFGDDVDLVSGILTGATPSAEINVTTEINNHGIAQIIDALAVQTIIEKLNPSYGLDETGLLISVSSNNPGLSEESFINSLSAILLDGDQAKPLELDSIALDYFFKPPPWDARTEIHARLVDLEIAIEGKGLSLTSFADLSATDIEAFASIAGDAGIAYRYALDRLNSFALTGDVSLYKDFNINGQLDLANDPSGSGQMSNEHLTDRAMFLYHRMHPDVSSPLDVDIEFNDLSSGKITQTSRTYDEFTPDIVDYKFGSESGESISGTAGDDHLYGMGGADNISGGSGNDLIEGGRGKDFMNGGYGDDTFIVNGKDSEADTFIGGDGNDKILGGVGDDTIRVDNFDGDNTVEFIDGGGGTNTLAGTDSSNTINLTKTTLSGIDSIDMGANNDTLKIKEFTNLTIDGGEGDDTIMGSDEADLLDLSQAAITNFEKVDGGAGNDVISSDGSVEKILGGAGDDIIYGSSKVETLDGGADNDTLYGRGGDADTIIGGTGDDELHGDGGDTLEGGRDYDQYIVGNGAIIEDSDGSGLVILDDIVLTGGIKQNKDDDFYVGGNGIKYFWDRGELTIETEDGSEIIIKKFNNKNLGIYLDENEEGDEDSGDSRDATGGYDPNNSSDRIRTTDPLVLDMNGDGQIGTVGIENSTAYFDLNQDGFAQKTGWVTPEDGILAIDRNENNFVDDISEVFGNDDTDGFAELDTVVNDNGDRVIDNKDTLFSKLKIWRDLNQDGVSQADELTSLDAENITSINLDFEQVSEDSNGNIIMGNGQFVRNGEINRISEIAFQNDSIQTKYNPIHSTDSNIITELNETSLNLPWLRGYGQVPDLHVAYTKDEQLQTLASNLITGGTEYVVQNFDSLLSKWSGLDALHTANGIDRKGELSLQDKIWILETFSGQSVWKDQVEQNFTTGSKGAWNRLDPLEVINAAYINEKFTYLNDYFLGNYILQSTLGSAAEGSFYSLNRDGFVVNDVQTAQAAFIDTFNSIQSPAEAVFLLRVLLQENSSFKLDLSAIKSGLGESEAAQTVSELILGDYVEIQALHTYHLGSNENSYILGTNQDDYFIGNGGDDYLAGGKGDDYLVGGRGDDIYVFGRGDGNDTIYDADSTVGNVDTVRLESGITAEDVIVFRDLDSLYIRIKETGEELKVKNWFQNVGNQIEQIIFDDGIIWDSPEIVAKIEVLSPSEGNDSLFGTENGDVIDGLAGNDKIYGMGAGDQLSGGTGNDQLRGGGGNDLLTGGAGDDNLYGEAGDDVLDGSVGNDVLSGNSGNDRYLFGRGDGQDTINNLDLTVGRFDVLSFKAGIAPEDLIVKRVRSNLEVLINDSDDQVVVRNFFRGDANEGYALDAIEFADGQIWDLAYIKNLVQVGTVNNDSLYGYSRDDFLSGLSGNDWISGQAGNDIIEGGTGNDSLDGGAGNDTYIFGLGDGQDVINNNDRGAGRIDILKFKDSVSVGQVDLERDDNSLIIRIKETTDQIIATNFFLSDATAGHQLNAIQFSDGTNWDVEYVKAQVVIPSEGNDRIYGYEKDEVFDALAGDDQIRSYGGNDMISGGAGNDHLEGGKGNDVLVGGIGNDFLHGGDGSDLYQFGRGDGQDVIDNADWSNGRFDVLELKSGIAPADIRFNRNNSNLILSVNGTDDELIIQNYFFNDAKSGYMLNEIKFVDDPTTIWSPDFIKAELIKGTDGDDLIIGYATADQLSGGAGHDSISGRAGDDTLAGDSGQDSLRGGDGDDTLDGGEGNDYLDGGLGSDRYLFGRGDGRDELVNNDSGSASYDSLVFKEDVAPTDVVLKRFGSDLDVSIEGISDSLRVKYFFNFNGVTNGTLDVIEFYDGTIWSQNLIKEKVLTGTAGSDYLDGFTSNDVISGAGGSDEIYGRGGDDTLQGDSGNDILDGGAGNDRYLFDIGDGNDVIRNLDRTFGRTDVISFGVGVLPANVVIHRDDNDLLLQLGNNNSIRVDSYFVGDAEAGNAVDVIEFSDGTVWDIAYVKDAVLKGTEFADHIQGYASDDTITGNAGNDRIEGNDGNDFIYAGEGNDWVAGGEGNDTLVGEGGDDVLHGHAGADILHGGEGDDLLQGWDGDDVLSGGIGDDILAGERGNDVINGGAGNDILTGWSGDDTYLFNRGDGQDLIIDHIYNSSESGNEILRFGPDIKPGDLLFQFDLENDDLRIGVGIESQTIPFEELTDQIRIQNWYQAKWRIESIEFELTGEVYSVEGILQTMMAGDGEVKALYEGGILNAGAGDDVMYGNVNADTLMGGAGNDVIEGMAGDDDLSGNVGQDTLLGGAGDDVYRFSRGDGADEVFDQAFYRQTEIDGGVDTISFGSGITPENLVVQTTGNDIVIALKEGVTPFVQLTDKLTIRDFYSSENRIEYYTFSDGQSLIPQDILNLIYSDGDDTVVYENNADKIVIARGGDDMIVTKNGNDQLIGGAGNDQLNAGHGNDIYFFGRGDGRDIINDRGVLSEWYVSYDRDTIHMQGGLTRDDVIVVWGGALSGYYLNGDYIGKNMVSGAAYENHDNDLFIALKEAGKTIDLLSDRILVKDWFNKQTQIENLTFDDGTSLDSQGIMDAIFSDGDDTINLSMADQKVYINALDGNDNLSASQHNDIIKAGAGSDNINGGDGDDLLYGEAGDDLLDGGTGSDYLSGGAGNDTLNGADGADLFVGGVGSDILQGGLGDDRYIFYRGDGADIIVDEASFNDNEYITDRFGHDNWTVVRKEFDAGNDTIFFGEGITADDVVFFWDYAVDENGNPIDRGHDIGSNDLIVALKDPLNPNSTISELTDKIVIKDWYKRVVQASWDGSSTSLGNEADFPFYEKLNSIAVMRIENFRFVDGTILSGHDLITAMQSDRDDRIAAVDGEGSVLYGLAGNDVLTGHVGDDQLFGGEGNDRLDAGYGWNALDGGIGDDTYILSSENTPPWINQVSIDTITDSEGYDRILFLNDIAREDILFTYDGDDLLITYGLERQHEVRIVGDSVELFEMSDDSFTTREEINASLEEIAALYGTEVSEIGLQTLVNNLEYKSILYNAWTDQFVEHQATSNYSNIFTGNSDNEIVVGGSGSDDLNGHSGNDQLHGSAGDDNLNAGNGNDIYLFDRGDNNDIILDAEDPDVITGGSSSSGSGGGSGDYYGSGGTGGGSDADEYSWVPEANAAPSDDTLVFKNDIRFEDLEAYWATDSSDWNNVDANDLLLKINPGNGSDSWNDRAVNIDIIVSHYSGRVMSEWVENSSTGQWGYEQRQLSAEILTNYSDKALRQFAYLLTDKYDSALANTTDFGYVSSTLSEADSQTAYFEEYRQNADSVLIEQFYDKKYTIENILLESEGRVLSIDDVMGLLSTNNSEMIRGVDWSDNTISAEAGNDAVVGGELNDTITGGDGSDLLNGMMGDDTYLFNKGAGRDILKDSDYYDSDAVINEARAWSGRELSDESGQSVWDVNFNGTGDGGGYDTVRFGVGINMQNVDFVKGGLTGQGSDLYVGFGDKTNPANVELDWITEALGNADSFDFNHGNGNALAPDSRIYQDDIFLPDQFSPGKTVEEFVLTDGTRILSDDIEAGLDARQAYVNENESYLAAIEANGRDAKGYADQAFLDKWQKVDKKVVGTDGADILNAGDGDDEVSAGAGNDVINAGFGADSIAGGAGDDTYIYNRWDGQDTIIDSDGMDSLVFGPDLLLSDLVAALDPSTGNLTIGIVDEVEKLKAETAGLTYNPDPATLSQKIVIKNWHSQVNRLERFVFDDGTEMSAMEVYNHFFTSERDDLLNGLEGDNNIIAGGGNDSILLGEDTHTVDGGSGNDVIVTASGDDTILTGTGSDTVYAGSGNDSITSSGEDNQLHGEAGNDVLNGGLGRDAYHFGLGDGADQILDAGGIDTLVLEDAISLDSAWIVRDGNDVSVTLDDGSQVLIRNWSLAEHEIENIILSDGTVTPFDDAFFLRARNYEVDFLEDNSASGVIELGNPGEGVVYSVNAAAANGQFTVNPDGSWNYQPNQDFNGADQVVVSVQNSAGEIATSILNFNLLPVNDTPVVDAIMGQFAVLGSDVLTGVVDVSDIDGDVLNFIVSAPPGQGVLFVDQNGGWTYEPGVDFSDSDAATILIDDGNGGQVEALLAFTGNIYEKGDLVIGENGPEFIRLRDISKDDLNLSRNGYDLNVSVRDKGSITLTGYFAAAENGVEYLETIEGPLHLAKDVIIDPAYSGCNRFRNKKYADDTKTLIYGNKRGGKQIGGDGNDVLFGVGGRDKLYGKDGDDTLIGGASRDRLVGGDGADTLYGDAGSDYLNGNDGDDVLVGGEGNDRLNANDGNDWLFGDSGCDRLYGGDGDDQLNGGHGDDLLIGGDGADTYTFNAGDDRDRLWDKQSVGRHNSHSVDRGDKSNYSNNYFWKGLFSWCRQRNFQKEGDDIVRFGESVQQDDIALFMKNGTLQIQYGEKDVVSIFNQKHEENRIERFELADGSYLTDADINRVIQEMSAYSVNEGICLRSVEDVRKNEPLMAMISDSWHQV